MRAEDLDQTPAAQAALEALREATGERGGPMERHCLRLFVIAERLAGGQPIDRELLMCAAWLHDAGLWSRSPDSYVTDGARLAESVLAPFGFSGERLQRAMDACEQHHALGSREELGLEVELVRQADLVDASGGLVAMGVPRAWLRGLFRAVPRAGFAPMIAQAVAGELRERPASFARVFAPPRTLAQS